MLEARNQLLARTQEMAQIYVDRVVAFIGGAGFQDLQPADKSRLLAEYFNVTASLGRHTFAVLSLNGIEMGEHLPDLFERLQALEAVCLQLGAPTGGTRDLARRALSHAKAVQH